MKIEGKNTIIKKRGLTSDIVREVMNTYSLYWESTRELAQQLKRDTEYDSCKAVFDFILDNVRYEEDPAGVQWIRTPARLLHDGVGDCKSMAILCVSLLQNMGIDCFFRFVSFSKNNQITHVYTVTRSGLIIDPVERIDGQPIFNYASEYTFKKDMETTQISRLSGIAGAEDIYTPYMGGGSFIDNTIAANYLYSELDCLSAYLNIDPENREYLNQLDRVVVALNLYDQCAGNESLLNRASGVIQYMEDRNLFSFASVEESARENNLGELINKAGEILLGNAQLPTSGIYYEWWVTKIKEKDYNNITTKQRDSYLSSVGVGSKKEKVNKLLCDMQKSAPYFLYLFLGEKWIRENKSKYPSIYAKYLIERNMYNNWVTSTKTVLDADTVYNNLKSGFFKKTNQTPQQFVNSIIAQNGGKVGALSAMTIAAIVSGVVAIVIAVIQGIFQLIESNMAAPDNYASGVPDDNDFTAEAYNQATNKAGSGKWFLLAALAFIFIKNKK